jgi:hypothetical protein
MDLRDVVHQLDEKMRMNLRDRERDKRMSVLSEPLHERLTDGFPLGPTDVNFLIRASQEIIV